jgi:hypothetical protein
MQIIQAGRALIAALYDNSLSAFKYSLRLLFCFFLMPFSCT